MVVREQVMRHLLDEFGTDAYSMEVARRVAHFLASDVPPVPLSRGEELAAARCLHRYMVRAGRKPG
jgi:hypothetical protein